MKLKQLEQSYHRQKMRLPETESLNNKRQELRYELEVIDLQLGLLNHYCSQPLTNRNVEQFNGSYREAHSKLKNDFIEGYRELLKSAQEIYDKEKAEIVILDKETRPIYLKKFSTQIEAGIPSGDFMLKDKTDVEALREVLQQRYRLIENSFGEIQSAHPNLSDEWLQHEKLLMYNTQKVRLKGLGYGKLQIACALEELETIQAILRFKDVRKDINKLDIHGYSALHIACQRGDVRIVEYLLKLHADPLLRDNESYPVIKHAIEKCTGNTKQILDLLFKSKEGNKIILARGPYERNAFHFAAFYGNLAAAKWLVKNEFSHLLNNSEKGDCAKRTPLYLAVYKGHFNLVKFFLSNYSNPLLVNKNKESVLFEATYYGNAKIAKLLIDNGVWFNETDREALPKLVAQYRNFASWLERILQEKIYLPLEQLLPLRKNDQTISSKEDTNELSLGLIKRGLFFTNKGIIEDSETSMRTAFETEDAREWLSGKHHENGKGIITDIDDCTLSIHLVGADIIPIKKQLLFQLSLLLLQSVGKENYKRDSFAYNGDDIVLEVQFSSEAVKEQMVAILECYGFSVNKKVSISVKPPF